MKEPIMSLSFVYVASADFHTSHQLTGTRMGCAGLQKLHISYANMSGFFSEH